MYELTRDETPIRGYTQIDAAWRENGNAGFWLGVLLLIGAVGMGSAALCSANAVNQATTPLPAVPFVDKR